MNENNDNRINQIKNELYKRGGDISKAERNYLKSLKKKDIQSKWGELPENNSEDNDLYKFTKSGPSIFSVILIISLVFFVSAVSFAFFYFAFDKNEIKSEVGISITGPNSIKSGENLDFLIKMENPTKLDYKDIQFFIEYPKSTIDPDTNSFVTNETFDLKKQLLAGGEVGKKFNAVLSGTAGETKEIAVTIFYKIGNFSNILSSKRIYKIEINSAPVSVEMEYPKEVLSKKEFNFKINVLSNTENTLENLIIVSKYPAGFKVLKTVPEAVFSNTSQNVFKVKKIKPGEKKEIIVTGVLVGQDNENKFFSFEVGDSIPFRNEIRTLFSKTEKEIAIKRPDIDLKVFSEKRGYKGAIVAAAGSRVDIKTILENNLKSVISDLKIKVKFPGDLIEKRKVLVGKGFYNSSNSEILWEKNTNPEMKSLRGGDSIENSFDFELVELAKIAGYVKDPIIKMDFEVEGTNFNDENSKGNVLEKFTKNIKIPTEILLKENILYDKGPFKNTGGRKPKVDKASTYTIEWKVYNTSSDISDVKVVAKLPLYIKFLDNVLPKNAYVSYNPETREVSWSKKKIEAFIGYRTDPKTVQFQVEYIPTAPQVGSRPVIIEKKILTAKDEFIDRDIEIIEADKRLLWNVE